MVCAAVCGAGEPRTQHEIAQREIAQGDVFAAAGKFEDARRAFTRAIEADPTSAEVYVKRAICSAVGRAFDPAIKDLSEAIRLDPTLEEAYCLRAWAYRITGAWDGVVRDGRRVKSGPLPSVARPDDLAYRNARSLLGISQNQFRRIDDLAFFASEWQCAADAAAQRDGLTTAEAKKRAAATPKDASGFCERGRCHVLTHEFEKAAADLNKAVEMGARDADTFLLRALVRGRRGDLPEAIADLNRSLALAPKSSRAFLVHGLANLGLGEHTKAIEDMTRAIELDPKDPNGYCTRAQVFFDMGDFDKGVSDLRAAVSLKNAESYRLWEYSGRQ
ncbi:MAG: tetratricopeptide repeat protein [Thermoguttaceae bacterium]